MSKMNVQSEDFSQDEEPLVSVIINCFNGEKYIQEAIDSVLAQTYQNWEIIFWDNQSKDRSAEIVKSYTDSRIVYLYAEAFTPLGEARNLAIQKAQGTFIAFLDADDKWLPEKLTRQIPLFRDPEVGLVICDTYYFDDGGIKKQLYQKKKPPTGHVFRELLGRYFISLETAVIRRNALDSLEYWFDSRFDVIEEYDLFVRLSYQWKLGYVDEVLAMWRVHGESWTWTREDLFPVERKMMLDSLAQMIPSFDEEYEYECLAIRRSCALSEAESKWAEGKNREARFIMREYKSTGIKWMLVYGFMWAPYHLYKSLRSILGVIYP